MSTKTTNKNLVNNSNLSPIEFLEQRIVGLENELKELSLKASENRSDSVFLSYISNDCSLIEIDLTGCIKELELLKSGQDKPNGFVFDIRDYSGKRLADRMDKIFDKYFKEKD